MKIMDWNSADIHRLIEMGLSEDQAHSDITTQALIRSSWKVHAEIRSKQRGVVAGLPLAELFFKKFDAHCLFMAVVKDGTAVRAGQPLARIQASARSVLSAERPALNALQHLSGIATFTQVLVQRLGRSKTKLLDTRKTLPGWRLLEKYAVRCGGGTNHRMSLGDEFLIKENHLKISRLAKANWLMDVERSRMKHHKRVQVEIQTADDLQEAVRLRPELVLLDNMPFAELKKVIHRLRKELPQLQIEISGGVQPSDLKKLGTLGVERISMGRLTHSAPAFDCSLDITRVDAA